MVSTEPPNNPDIPKENNPIWRRIWVPIWTRSPKLIMLLLGAAGAFLLNQFFGAAYSGAVTLLSQRRMTVIIARPNDDHYREDVWKEVIKFAREQHCQRNENLFSCNSSYLNIEHKDDGDDNSQRLVFAKTLMSDFSVVAVLGHQQSSDTESAMPAYCNEATGSMPLIMTDATETDIVKTASDMGCKAVLRLPPTNKTEGEIAAKLVSDLITQTPDLKTDQVGPWIAIFRDQTNPSYSNDLGAELDSAVMGPKVLLSNGVGGTLGGPIVSGEIAPFPVSILFIAGGPNVVLQALRQMYVLKQEHALTWKPSYYTILSDGAFSSDVISKGEGLLSDHTYVISNVDTSNDILKKLQNRTDVYLREPKHAKLNGGEKDNKNREILERSASFAYVYDGILLVMRAIDNLHDSHKAITRRNLANLLSSWKTSGNTGAEIGAEEFISQEKYSFDKDGNSKDNTESVYKYDEVSNDWKFIRDYAADESR
jgi:hypothetical protein